MKMRSTTKSFSRSWQIVFIPTRTLRCEQDETRVKDFWVHSCTWFDLLCRCSASSDVQLIDHTDASSSNATKDRFRFSFPAVTFPDPSRTASGLVYVHCRVQLCPANECTRPDQCSGASRVSRKRRSVTESRHVSAGPMLVELDTSGEWLGFKSWRVWILIVHLLACLPPHLQVQCIFDNVSCCYTEIQVTDQTCSIAQSSFIISISAPGQPPGRVCWLAACLGPKYTGIPGVNARGLWNQTAWSLQRAIYYTMKQDLETVLYKPLCHHGFKASCAVYHVSGGAWLFTLSLPL